VLWFFRSGPGVASGEPVRLIGVSVRRAHQQEGCHEGISRVIEIRGDQKLEYLHQANFKAYDRWDKHPYEFEQAIPTVTYPRVIKRVGKSPPRYREE
jgi:hypothetical protein